ncbi:hypothetical protein FRX31_004242, partial [Thalictrum thalictroides]
KSTWDFGPGEFSVSHENWLGTGCLATVLPQDCPQYTLKYAAAQDFCLPIFQTATQNTLRE